MFKLFLIVFILSLISCDTYKDAVGRDDRIVVFGEESLWQSMEDTLNATLAAPWELPTTERKYILAYKDLENFEMYKLQKNLLFLISENQKNVLNKLTSKLIPATFQEHIKNETYNFFVLKNVYAKNQLVLFFVVNDYTKAADIFGEQFNKLETFKLFENLVFERMNRELYKYEEDENALELMTLNHGYSFRTPYRFQVVDNNAKKDSNLISIFSRNPIQWAIGRKIYNVEKDDFTVDLSLNERDYMMNHYFEGDSVDRSVLDITEVTLDSLNGYRIQGAYKHYENKMLIAGGPFVSYALYDDQLNMVYLLDGHVFDLGKRKTANLMKIETVLKTFTRPKNK